MQLLIDCSRSTGRAFFAMLVNTMAQVLGVRHVLLCEWSTASAPTLHSVATWSNGRWGEQYTFTPGQSPFITLALEQTTVISRGARRRFPDDQLLNAFGADGVLGAPLRSASGAVIGLLLALNDHDISLEGNPVAVCEIFAGRAATELEREQAEQELHDQRNEFQQMLDAVNASVWRLDTAGRIVQGNRVARRLTPELGETLISKTLSELFPQDPDIRSLEEQCLAVMASGEAQLGQIIEWTTYDQIRWSSVDKIPLRDDEQQVNGLLVFIYGITELKSAEAEVKELNAELEHRVAERTAQLAAANEALRRGEARQRALLEAMPDLFFRIRHDGVFLDFATPAHAATLMPRDQIIGAHIRDLAIPDSAINESLAAYQRALETGAIQTVEYSVGTDDDRSYFESRIVRNAANSACARSSTWCRT